VSRTSRKVIEARKERARKEDEHRRWLEAEIAKLGPNPTEAELDALGLFVPWVPPAEQFMIDKLKGVPLEQFDDEWKRAVCDLVASNVPLDAYMRKLLAGELRRLYFPNPEHERQEKGRLEAQFWKWEQRWLEQRGETALDAEEMIAESHGLSVAALRKRKQRARK
jgi:hypothetical protein